MNIDPADFDQGPTKTDEGFIVEFHAQDGCQRAIIGLTGLPHGYEQVAQVRIDGVRYVYDYTDECTGNLVFTEFDPSPPIPAVDDEPTPALPSEFDEPIVDVDTETANLIDAVQELGGDVLVVRAVDELDDHIPPFED